MTYYEAGHVMYTHLPKETIERDPTDQSICAKYYQNDKKFII